MKRKMKHGLKSLRRQRTTNLVLQGQRIKMKDNNFCEGQVLQRISVRFMHITT